jgi:hypothetical protein
MEKISFVWTIVLGLVIGVAGNLLTPITRRLLGKISTSARHRNETKRKVFDLSVKYLIDNPFDETNLRIEKNAYLLTAAILMVLALLISSTAKGIFEIVLSVLLVLGGLYSFIKGRRISLLVLAAFRHRKKNHPDIDLGW